ncbi:hypothetical protein K438DRAFT_1984663 [Mycena galopus ATCC 62051]|nr:hypothetical protein K438DRAFT_1984663 [Mycena galopus ATCC 62051]
MQHEAGALNSPVSTSTPAVGSKIGGEPSLPSAPGLGGGFDSVGGAARSRKEKMNAHLMEDIKANVLDPTSEGVFTQLFGLYWSAIKFNIAHWHIASLLPLSGAVTVWSVGSVARDVLITLALTGILWRRKRQTTFADTTGILNRSIHLSGETGALTSATGILEIIL